MLYMQTKSVLFSRSFSHYFVYDQRDGSVARHVAGCAETVLQGEDRQQQGHARGIEMQHAHHQAERGHDRAAGHARRAHREDAEKHNKEGHRTHGRQSAVEHQTDGHDEKGFGQHRSAQVHGGPERNHEFGHRAAENRRTPRAREGHGQRRRTRHGADGGQIGGQIIAHYLPRIATGKDAADDVQDREPDVMADDDDADDLEEDGKLHREAALIGEFAEGGAHEERQERDDDALHHAGHDAFKLVENLVDGLGLGPACGQTDEQGRDKGAHDGHERRDVEHKGRLRQIEQIFHLRGHGKMRDDEITGQG
mgnify:CR=1 FL=1